ncbi:hypothetical protein QQS21_012409 [Conoideocrella luteorostrata]|uniref:DUF952 domain-containing protein n=1 Tax=Conoideocrella luteorostrata TaxID=1105319 RepID=A0AAJ0FSQ7_9HYPO|nr:hypothetical protein QQS21_012409 [Conoideocrella luteorostrata]
MSAESPPKYVYKIVPAAPPDTIPEQFPLSDLDKQDGFVHLSTNEQVPLTCDRFFNSTSTLWLFKFELAKFSHPVKWEGGFPHLYGNFGGGDIVSVEKFDRGDGRTWADAMGGSAWLQ